VGIPVGGNELLVPIIVLPLPPSIWAPATFPIITLEFPELMLFPALAPITVFSIPNELYVNEFLPTTVLELIFPPPLPTVTEFIKASPATVSNAVGFVCPIPT